MKSRLFIIVALAFIFLMHCERDKNPVSPSPGEFIYPIKIGNEWSYERLFYYSGLDVDSTSSLSRSDTSSLTSVIKVVKETTLLDSTLTFQFNETAVEDGTTYLSETYYSNRADGFYMHGYKSAGTMCLPKSNVANKILFKGYAFNSIREITDFLVQSIPLHKVSIDSLIIEQPPIKILEYPLKVGARWSYRLEHDPWRIDREVLATEAVQVPAGKFVCYKIRFHYDFDNDGEWDKDVVLTDYVSSKGLVKRTGEYLGLEQTDETGTVIDSFESGEEIKLISVKLK